MKQQRSYPKVIVTKKAECSIKAGHPWVYFDEITSSDEISENGCLTDVFSKKGSWLGCGFYSAASKIRVRLLSDNPNETFSSDFWRRRVGYALDYRKTVMSEYYPKCSRLIFGEADSLPGLTVDRYNNIIVSEVLSYGMEKVKDIIYEAVFDKFRAEGFPIDGIYERNDSLLRKKEALESFCGWYETDNIKMPACGVTEITENGIVYSVDVVNGQKTGFFLDQKYNRHAVSMLAKGKNVLDCFTHTGSFALNAAKGGAFHVTAVDVSATAIEMAKRNAEKNKLDGKVDFIVADVFDLLPSLSEKKSSYDMIILDPPAFTKSRKTVPQAQKGYKEINYRAMRMLPRGGILATCSCSHFFTDEMFRRMLGDAARDAGVGIKIIEARHQSPDHPILLNVPETDYLKFYTLQIV